MAREFAVEDKLKVGGLNDVVVEIVPDIITKIEIIEDNNAINRGSITYDHINHVFNFLTQGINRFTISPLGVTIIGDLNVTGSTTTVSATNLSLSDSEILLNEGESGPGITNPSKTAGILVDRGFTTSTVHNPASTGTGNLTYTANTIIRTIGDWGADGTIGGSFVRIFGSTSNDGEYTVLSVDSAIQITVVETLTPGGPESVTKVLVGNTKLTRPSWKYNDGSGKKWWEPSSNSPVIGSNPSFKTIGNIEIIDTTTADNSLVITGNGSLKLPRGTTSQRPTTTPITSQEPVSPALTGLIRFNTDLGKVEVREPAGWRVLVSNATGDETGITAVIEDTSPQLGGDLDILTQAITTSISNGNIVLTPNGTGEVRIGQTGIPGTVSAEDAIVINTSGQNLIIRGGNGNGTGNGGNVLIQGGSGATVGSIQLNSSIVLGANIISNMTIAGNILPNVTNTRNIGSALVRFSTMYATTFDGIATQARYADLAERYEADDIYESGTVVIFGGEKEVTTSYTETDCRVAGVVSTNPGLMLNSEAGSNDTHPYIALKGKVPCKIVGPVCKGDLIVTSNIPGHGMSAGHNAHQYTAFARAIENSNLTENETGIIMVAII